MKHDVKHAFLVKLIVKVSAFLQDFCFEDLPIFRKVFRIYPQTCEVYKKF